MTLENLSVWTIPPNWSGEITETLEFLTGILASPIGAEQRFGLRRTPRRFFEMSFTRSGPFRTLFDLFIERASGSNIYLPLWHDSNRLTVDAASGSSTLTIESTAYTEFADCPGAILCGASPFEYEIAEISSVTSTQILLASALTTDWPLRTRVFPLQKCRIETQPSATRRADRTYEARVKFSVNAPNPTSATVTLPTYNNHFVLEREPNDVDDLTFQYDRLLAELDNQTGKRTRADLNAWGITNQQFSFFLRGRADHAWARAFFYTLCGRQYPIFVPTFFADFDVVEPIASADKSITVKRCGYTDYDGPFRGRQYILVHLKDNSRLYRHITGSALIGDGAAESLIINTSLGRAVQPDQIKRISFLPLCRLDQDSIEIVHHTDTGPPASQPGSDRRGLATCTTIFRSISQTRNPIPDPSEDDTHSDDEGGGSNNSAGLFYFEITFGDFNGAAQIGVGCGFATDNFDIDQNFNIFNHIATNYAALTGSNFNNFGLEGVSFWCGDPGSTALGGYPNMDYSNQTMGFAVNTATGLYWVRNTADPDTWHAGDGPVSGLNGSPLGGGIDPAKRLKILIVIRWDSGAGSNVASATINGGGSFTATIPTGARPWGAMEIAAGSNSGGFSVVGNTVTGATGGVRTGYFFYGTVDKPQTW